MATPLIATKLHQPSPRRSLVVRPRLHARLRHGAGARLLLVSAPAGFGKTTLVTAWLGTLPDDTAVAWLSLDERDDDPSTFWSYVLASLRAAVPELGVGAQGLLESDAPSDAVIASLLNELHAIDRDVVLVLDDFHAVARREIQDAVTTFLDHLPRGRTSCSRAEPIPHSRSRAFAPGATSWRSEPPTCASPPRRRATI